MNETTWWKCDDPRAIFTHLSDSLTDRQCRLFAHACGRRYCRHCWVLECERSPIPGETGYRPVRRPQIERLGIRMIEAAEEQCDGTDRRREIELLRQSVAGLGAEFSYRRDLIAVVEGDIEHWLTRQVPRSATESRFLAELLREIVGNPFQQDEFDPNWRTPTVQAIAQAAYEEPISPLSTLDPLHISVLADALEDVGCDDDNLLSHLRDGSEHVRGCWALERILGKE